MTPMTAAQALAVAAELHAEQRPNVHWDAITEPEQAGQIASVRQFERHYMRVMTRPLHESAPLAPPAAKQAVLPVHPIPTHHVPRLRGRPQAQHHNVVPVVVPPTTPEKK